MRGKYDREAAPGAIIVLIDSALVKVFPAAEAVNRVLRPRVDTAAAVAAPPRHSRKTPNGRRKRTA